MTEITTLQAAEQYAAQHAIALSPSDRAKITAAQQAELQRLKALGIGNERRGWTDRWNSFYPRFLQMILSFGETLLTFSQTVIVSLGIPSVLVLLLIVEHQRVLHGIGLFEPDAALASFASGALVLLNLVLEFQVHHIEQKAGYTENRENAWSLKIWWENFAYKLGVMRNWKPRPLSPAERYRRLLRLVTFSILSLALAGSMRTVIEQTPGTWHEAIGAILTQSTLMSAMVWAGGLLFAAAAVLSAQGLSRYVAIRCVEIIASMSTRAAVNDDPYAEALDAAAANVVMAIVADKQAKRAAKDTPKPIEVNPIEMRPFGSSHPGLGESENGLTMPKNIEPIVNGNGNGHKV